MTDHHPEGAVCADRSDQHKHMDYVQDIIARLANNSFLMKGWALTLSSALVGFAISQHHAGLALAALIPTLGFWVLDAYYLRRERAFRDMYDDVAGNRLRDFRIDPGPYVDNHSRWSVARSASLNIFYILLAVVAVAVALVLLTAGSANKDASHRQSQIGITVEPSPSH